MPLSDDCQTELPADLIVDFPQVPRNKQRKSERVSFMANSSLRLYHEDQDRQHSSWYNKVDYYWFRQNTRAEILSARQMDGKNFDTDHEVVCTVGVEIYLSQELLSEVMERREIHKLAILREQARQQEFGCIFQEVLASLSQEYSRWACSRASLNARKLSSLLSRTTRRSESPRAA